jgi:hypothetical protein
VKKAAHPVERRKHDHRVIVDRRRQDEDFAERMAGGIQAWSPQAVHPEPFLKKHRHH